MNILPDASEKVMKNQKYQFLLYISLLVVMSN